VKGAESRSKNAHQKKKAWHRERNVMRVAREGSRCSKKAPKCPPRHPAKLRRWDGLWKRPEGGTATADLNCSSSTGSGPGSKVEKKGTSPIPRREGTRTVTPDVEAIVTSLSRGRRLRFPGEDVLYEENLLPQEKGASTPLVFAKRPLAREKRLTADRRNSPAGFYSARV